MADIVSRARRSEIMGRIRGKDTTPELLTESPSAPLSLEMKTDELDKLLTRCFG